MLIPILPNNEPLSSLAVGSYILAFHKSSDYHQIKAMHGNAIHQHRSLRSPLNWDGSKPTVYPQKNHHDDWMNHISHITNF